MDYAGYYINLDRAPERRAALEAELSRHGLRETYTRVAAADGNALHWPNPHNLKPGVMGCFASHYLALKQSLDRNRQVHIVEDDIVIAPAMPQAILWAIDTGKLDNCDILYTDVSVPVRSDVYRMYRAMYGKMVAHNDAGAITRVAFDAFNLKGTVYASAASYLVNRRSIPKLLDLYDEEIARGPALPVDLFLRQKSEEGKIKTACLFPFVTSISFESVLASSVAPELDLPTAVTRIIGRRCFYVACDWNECRQYIEQFLPRAGDAQAQVLADLLAFSLTDAYHLA